MAGEGEVCIGGVKLACVDGESFTIERTQLAFELVGDRQVVEAGWEFGPPVVMIRKDGWSGMCLWAGSGDPAILTRGNR